MSLRFTGSFEDLKSRLTALDAVGKWIDTNTTQKQYRHHTNGGIINWYVSTGTIAFQGKPDGKEWLEAVVRAALTDQTATTLSATTPSRPTPAIPEGKSPQTSDSVPPSRDGALSYLGNRYADSELVIGLVGAVGTELKQAMEIFTARLKSVFGYDTNYVHISNEIIPTAAGGNGTKHAGEFDRITALMNAGNKARQDSKDNSILALGVAARISQGRERDPGQGPQPKKRVVHIVSSLKHPDEVTRLREIYSEGFYLVGVHCDIKRRTDYLVKEKRVTPTEAEKLIGRDEDENLPHGQRTSDTFHLSEFLRAY